MNQPILLKELSIGQYVRRLEGIKLVDGSELCNLYQIEKFVPNQYGEVTVHLQGPSRVNIVTSNDGINLYNVQIDYFLSLSWRYRHFLNLHNDRYCQSIFGYNLMDDRLYLKMSKETYNTIYDNAQLLGVLSSMFVTGTLTQLRERTPPILPLIPMMHGMQNLKAEDATTCIIPYTLIRVKFEDLPLGHTEMSLNLGELADLLSKAGKI